MSDLERLVQDLEALATQAGRVDTDGLIYGCLCCLAGSIRGGTIVELSVEMRKFSMRQLSYPTGTKGGSD